MIPLRAETAPGPAPDRGYLRALRRQQGARRRAQLQSLAALSLALAGWAAVTLLTTLGLFAVAFFLLGNASLLGMMHQLELFAGHYGAAAPDARASFNVLLLKVFVLLLAGVGFFRRFTLKAILSPKELRRG